MISTAVPGRKIFLRFINGELFPKLQPMKILRNILILIPVMLLSASSLHARSQRDSIIDGIVGIVGGNVILISDIENQYMQLSLIHI